MNLFLPKIERFNFGWNAKHLNEEDFYSQCKINHIEIIETPMRLRGICWYVMDQHVITINSKLVGHEKLFTMWHEFGHFLMHFPNKTVGTYFWGEEQIYSHQSRRQENEADAFALCALIPRNWVECKTLRELVEDDYFTEETVWKRKKVYEKFKI